MSSTKIKSFAAIVFHIKETARIKAKLQKTQGV